MKRDFSPIVDSQKALTPAISDFKEESMKRVVLVTTLSTFCMLFFITCSVGSHTSGSPMDSMKFLVSSIDSLFQPTAFKLLARGMDTTRVAFLLADPTTKFLEKMVKINVSGFIKKADYSHNFSASSVKAASEFYAANKPFLQTVQQKTGVSAEVITSILWVETKFGKYTGDNHVVSVYASLATADLPKNIEMNKQTYRSSITNIDTLLRLDSVVEARAIKKANWAIEQLFALDSIDNAQTMNIRTLKGSWAGAFGLSQFIPSSYRSWAVDGDADGKIDLYNKLDAMASVGNYLQVNGWTSNQKDQEKAVYHYNNSSDYVHCVLTLARKISEAN